MQQIPSIVTHQEGIAIRGDQLGVLVLFYTIWRDFTREGKRFGVGGAFQKAYGAALSGSLLWHLTARRDQRLLSNKLSLASRSGTGTCRPVGGALRHLRQLSVKARREAASPKFYSPSQPLSFFFFFLIPDSPPPALLTLVLDRFIEPVSRCELLTPLRCGAKTLDGLKPVASLLAFCTLSCRRRFSHKLFLTLVLDEPETGREIAVYSVRIGGRKKKKEMYLEHIKKECKA